MCEKKTCPHRGDDMCTCMKRGNTAEEWIADLVHLCGHITEAKWELEYTALDSPKQRRLCLVGHCRSCGKRLCTGVHIPETLDRDEFLSAAFLHMGLYGRSIGMDTASPAFREMHRRISVFVLSAAGQDEADKNFSERCEAHDCALRIFLFLSRIFGRSKCLRALGTAVFLDF